MKNLNFGSVEGRQKTLLYFLLALLFVVYLAGLFIDVTRDAAKYAYIPKEMIQNHQWINLKILGEPYNQKPHFMFWLSAISYLVFGASNFSFKLPILLYSLLGLYFTYKLGERIYSKKVGVLASIMVAFSIIFILYNQDLHTDTILFTSSAFALWQLYEYLTNQRWRNLILSGVALGLCLLSKGPFGVIVPFLAVMGYLIAQRKWQQMFRIHWLYLILIAFTFALPVFYQMYINWGLKGISFFFFGNTMGRFTGSYLGHTPDPSFYIHNTVYLFLPWSIVFFFALIKNTSKAYHKQFGPAEHYLFWGFVTFFVLMSVSTSKLPNYLMSALPVMAVMTSYAWLKIMPLSKSVIKIQNGVNYILWVLVMVILFYFSKNGTYWKVALLIIIFFSSYYFTKSFSVLDRLLYRALTGIVVTGLALNLIALPVIFGYQSQPRVAAFLNKQHLANPAVFNYQKAQNIHLKRLWENPDSTMIKQFNQTPNEKHFSYNYELMFYSNYPVKHVETETELKKALSNNDAWFFTDGEGKNEIEKQAKQIDTVITYEHFSLKRTAKLFTSSNESSPFVERYLIKTQPAHSLK